MENQEITRLLDRARRAYLRRPEFNGHAPRMADSDILQRGGREWVVLRDGEETLAEFQIRANGDLRHVPGGSYGFTIPDMTPAMLSELRPANGKWIP